MTPKYLSVEQVQDLHRHQIKRYGGKSGVRSLELLEAAVSLPKQTYRGSLVHEDLPAMAAAYLYHLCSTRAFEGGNRRVGLAAALLFLSVNGYDVNCDPKEIERLTKEVAAGTADKTSIEKFFRKSYVGSNGGFVEAHKKSNLQFLRQQTDASAAGGLNGLLRLRNEFQHVHNDVIAAFQQTANLFKRLGEDFVVVGGLATSFHGEPRMTQDVDLLLQLARKPLLDLATRMRDAGFDIDPNEAAQQWDRLGFTHAFYEGTRIDLLSGSNEFQRSVFERASSAAILDQRVRLASVEDCILMKAQAWRLKDVPIAVELVERHESSINREYLYDWVSKLEPNHPEIRARVNALFDPALTLPPGIR